MNKNSEQGTGDRGQGVVRSPAQAVSAIGHSPQGWRGVRRAACGAHSRTHALTHWVAGLVVAVGLAACTPLDYALGYVPWFATMREEVSFDPYEVPRLPADGAIPVINPRGDVPPPFTQQDLVQNNLPELANPLAPTENVLLRGNVLYQRHCMPCHGPQGQGNGPVVGQGKFPFAPAAVGPLVASYTDAYLYGIIRVGRGLMPGYGDRMTHNDRWAVVLHLRELQQQNYDVPAAVVQPGEAVPESFQGQPDSIINPRPR